MRRGMGVGLAGAAALLWLGIASRNGTAGVGTGGAMHLPTDPPPTTIGMTTAKATPQVSDPPASALPASLQHLQDQVEAAGVWLLLAVAVVLVIAFLVRVLRRVRVDEPEEADGDVVPPTVDVGALDEASATSIVELRSGDDVAAAIVACWRRFEDLAAASDVPRQEWQDTSEYVVEVLGHTPAPAGDLGRLAELYRTACYAPTPPGEPERETAIACLQGIRRALAGVAA